MRGLGAAAVCASAVAGGDHRVEQRQRDGRAGAPQDGAAGKMLLRDEHGRHPPLCAAVAVSFAGVSTGTLSIWNAGLLTMPITRLENR